MDHGEQLDPRRAQLDKRYHFRRGNRKWRGAQLSSSGASVRRLRVGRSEGPGQLLVDAGGGLNVTENLHINESGFNSAFLSVQNGGTVTSPVTIVGYSASTNSHLQVTGTGSTFNATSSFIVARQGVATFNVANGGTLGIGGGTLPLQIATLAGSTGTAYIGNGAAAGALNASAVQFGAGTGSLWFNHTDNVTFFVPISGSGSLFKTGTGTTTLSTALSHRGHPSFDAATSIQRGTLDVFGLIYHPAADLEIGGLAGQIAALVVRDGSAVTNANGRIGDGVNSIGAATIFGATTTWTNSSVLAVGVYGTGVLSIENGAAVSSFHGRIGREAGSSGTVSVDGEDSNWQIGRELTVGGLGIGSLSILDGGSVTNAIGSIGNSSGSSGTATVTGADSTWTNAGELNVGYNGSGTLYVRDGGAVSNTIGQIGRQADAIGDVTVEGIGSQWTNSGSLLVGRFGEGSLFIENGGSVTNTFGYLGNSSGSFGAVTVTGAGSTWTNTHELTVGFNGTVELTVAGGGGVSSSAGHVGGAANLPQPQLLLRDLTGGRCFFALAG